MDSLVLSNIRQRPMRTLISVAGVALGVILILLNTGLVRGMLNDRIRREQGVGAEIQFLRPGSKALSPSSAMPLDVRYADRLKQIPGVQGVSPIGHYVQSGNSGLGIEVVDGIEFDTYSAMSNLRIVEGRAFQADDEVIVDDFKAKQGNLGVGDEIQVFGNRMKVVGIFSPQIGSRIKMSLGAMQRALSAENKCFAILVKVDDRDRQEEVARRIDAELPGNQVLLTRDIGLSFGRDIPGIQGFVRAVMGLSIVVSALVILLAMYTTITERTREIGILKSLGASKLWIAWVFEKEALLISLLGVVGGLVIAAIARYFLVNGLGWKIDLEADSILYASIAGLVSGLLGALYPALRAASQDPVEALSYE